MKLSVFERLVLAGMLAQHQGNFVNLKLIREAREALSLTEEEQTRWEVRQMPDGKVAWKTVDDDGTLILQDAEIPIGETVMNIIRKDLQTLDQQEKLKDEHFTLYEKFMNGGFHG